MPSIFTTTKFETKTKKKLNLIFSKKIDNKIILNPKFIYNYKSGKKNIILQDSDYNLIVLDMNGKETLRKKLNSIKAQKFFLNPRKTRELY